MKLNTLLFAILLLAISISATAQTFNKQSISFTLPSGWEVTEEEDISKGEGYYLSAEKTGHDASGLIDCCLGETGLQMQTQRFKHILMPSKKM